jgi:hypothetical protein
MNHYGVHGTPEFHDGMAGGWHIVSYQVGVKDVLSHRECEKGISEYEAFDKTGFCRNLGLSSLGLTNNNDRRAAAIIGLEILWFPKRLCLKGHKRTSSIKLTGR